MPAWQRKGSGKQLGGKAISIAKKDELSDITALHRAHKRFTTARTRSEDRLRRFVRNRIAAHRIQLFVETNSEAFAAVTDGGLKELIIASRQLLRAMQSTRIWFWASSTPKGDVLVRRYRDYDPKDPGQPGQGFTVPSHLPNRTGLGAIGEHDIADGFTCASAAEATRKANTFWGMKGGDLYCCGKPFKAR